MTEYAETVATADGLRSMVLALMLPETRGCRCWELHDGEACGHCVHMAAGILVDLRGAGWTLERIAQDDGTMDGINESK